MRFHKLILFVLVSFLVATDVQSQTVIYTFPASEELKIVWQYSDNNRQPERFLLFINDIDAIGKPVDLGLPELVNGDYTAAIPNLPVGTYVLTLRGADSSGLFPPASVTLVRTEDEIILIPGPPINIRIEPRN